MRKATIFIVLALLLVLCGTPVLANGILPLPHAFYGDVTINGSPAPPGTTIEARGAGVQTSIKDNPITTTESGKFGKAGALEPKLIVQGDILDGAIITFYVNGHLATTDPAIVEWHSGEVTELLLSVTIPAPPPPAPPPSEPGVTDVSDSVDEDGNFTQDVTAESKDGKVELFIEEDTIGLTEEGEPLSEISIIEMEEPPDPPEDSNVIGLVYDLGPDGATFDQPITLCFTYDPALLPEGVCEECLRMAMWDGANWVDLEGPFTIDLENNTICVPIRHFTPFAFIAYTNPAAFTASDLAITPTEVDIGETVVISARVTNTGCLADSYEVTLKIDGEKVASEDVILAGRASKEVSFTTARDVPGTYTVDVDGLSGSFTVVAPAAFSVTALSVKPLEVQPKEVVTITVSVANTGGESGSCKVTLKIDGVVEATKEVTVNAGFSKEVTFSVTKEEAGSYSVVVDGLTGSFTVAPVVVPPEPAVFSVSSLSVLPAEVEPDETVTITVLVANAGGESGSYTVVLKIDGVKEAEETVTIAAGESQDVSFSVTKEEAGSYTVAVDGLSGSFTVVPVVAPSRINWPLIGGVIGGVIVVGLLIFFWMRRRAY